MTNLEKYSIIIGELSQRIELGKKMTQKLLYLMERKGVQLDLNYSIHYFGPYSAKLDAALHTLESFGAIEIDTTGMTHIIREGKSLPEKKLNSEDEKKVEFVLEKFLGKTALELEAITTLDYAAMSILKGTYTDEKIVDEVIKIKGSKFHRKYLLQELRVLKDAGYIQ